MRVVYDHSFNTNEWFIILSLISLNILFWVTPKIFALLEGIALYMYGIYAGMFFDHTISFRPWDFYDVNDSSDYEIMDFLSYCVFCPISYFFIYLYVKLGVKGYQHIYYVAAWTCLSLLLEWVEVKVGVYHYQKGYKMYWSVPIYMSVQSLQIIYFRIIKSKSAKEKYKHL